LLAPTVALLLLPTIGRECDARRQQMGLATATKAIMAGWGLLRLLMRVPHRIHYQGRE